jgi:hypothetical protein
LQARLLQARVHPDTQAWALTLPALHALRTLRTQAAVLVRLGNVEMVTMLMGRQWYMDNRLSHLLSARDFVERSEHAA